MLLTERNTKETLQVVRLGMVKRSEEQARERRVHATRNSRKSGACLCRSLKYRNVYQKSISQCLEQKYFVFRSASYRSSLEISSVFSRAAADASRDVVRVRFLALLSEFLSHVTSSPTLHVRFPWDMVQSHQPKLVPFVIRQTLSQVVEI